jgi:hypothetical protein
VWLKKGQSATPAGRHHEHDWSPVSAEGVAARAAEYQMEAAIETARAEMRTARAVEEAIRATGRMPRVSS